MPRIAETRMETVATSFHRLLKVHQGLFFDRFWPLGMNKNTWGPDEPVMKTDNIINNKSFEK